MNASFTMVKKSIILADNSLEIYHAGFINTMEEYDWVITTALRYLGNEGFLENHPLVDNIHVFDYKGTMIEREKCR